MTKTPFHVGQRVKLTAEGIRALGHVWSGANLAVRYNTSLRGTVVNPSGKNGSVEVRRDGIRRVDGYAPEFWEDENGA